MREQKTPCLCGIHKPVQGSVTTDRVLITSRLAIIGLDLAQARESRRTRPQCTGSRRVTYGDALS